MDAADRGAELSRRALIAQLGVGCAASLLASVPALGAPGPAVPVDVHVPSKRGKGGSALSGRRARAYRLRVKAARMARKRGAPKHVANGDEEEIPFVNAFSKGLPHDAVGEVDPAAYALLRHAARTGEKKDFLAVPLAGERRLVNPLAGVAYDLEGPDCGAVTLPPAPRLASDRTAAELVELYWQALLRDVPLLDYDTNPLAAAAVAELSSMAGFGGALSAPPAAPRDLFRNSAPGVLKGPYLSQFLLRDIPYGTLTVPARGAVAAAGPDYLSDVESWLLVQRGGLTGESAPVDPVARLPRTGRDLATYVHFDALCQAYFNACLVLLGLGAPLRATLPYGAPGTMDGFATFGPPHVLGLVAEVSLRALKAVWMQKWYVHRRARPEAVAGRLHFHLAGERTYPLHADLLGADAPARIFAARGTHLLPQAYPEGSPLHPSYGSGHTTVAGACVTVLKAFFDEDWPLPAPVVPDADGLATEPYDGADKDELTVGGELNKLAMNVSMARNFAGIHWRSDSTESLLLGEQVAEGILEEQRLTYAEDVEFAFTGFDGLPRRI